MHVFEPARIGPVELSNRILRSATFEGLADADGDPGEEYARLYAGLARQELGGLITGFAYVSPEGRAMHPGQAGIDSDARVAGFRHVARAVHENGGRIFLQVAHAGRQTVPAATGGAIYGPSTRRSPYFGHRPRRLTEAQIDRIVEAFAASARRAQSAGLDGVQLHGAHGYLIHQFLHAAINDRQDVYGIDPRRGIGTVFLERVIQAMRAACGPGFPLLIKVSAGDNLRPSFGEEQFTHLIRFLDTQPLDAIEISFGTMDQALNIFRGDGIPVDTILDFNPRHRTRNPMRRWLWKAVMPRWLGRELMPFTPMYNLARARLAKRHTAVPIVCVGGFRNGLQIREAVEGHAIDFVSLARPLLCEPDFVRRVRRDERYESRCANCNRCAIRCDSGQPTRCYGRRESGAEVQEELTSRPERNPGRLAPSGGIDV